MQDKAHQWTDEQIADLESRFASVYSQAASEMQGKLERALKAFDHENVQRQKAMDNTPESRKAYEDWKREQVASQTWMRDMVEELSRSANKANRHATDMINDSLPHTYAENANMAAFAVDKRLGYDTGFTLVNEDAVRHLMGLSYRDAGYDQLIREVTWNPDPERSHVQDVRRREVDYPKDMRWNRQKFTSAIAQGILQGESIPDIVKRTKSIYGMNRNSAIRAARTATTNAENAGRMSSFERAQALGIDMELEWLATPDGRTRPEHRELDGQRVKLGEKFVNSIGSIRWPGDPEADGANLWNCFIGEVNTVPLGCIERSFRRFYTGDAITVKTASGVEFTCTPNHPILTSDGWVAAGLLDDGYDLFIADLGNAPRGLGIEPDVKHVGTRFDAIHKLLDVNTSERASGVTVYFHEDIATRDVDVVGEKRPLRVNLDTLALEPVDKLALEPSNTLASSDGTLMIRGITPMTPSDSLMSSSSEPRALLGSGISHALEHGLRTVSGCDSSPLEPDIYDTSIDAEVLGESLHALSAVIKLDHVVNVDVHPISAHVYNLQTESGAYLVNNNDSIPAYVIAHNCRCRANGRVVGFDGKRGDWADERGKRWTRLPKGMTYDEWRKAKAVSRDKSYENPSEIREGFWAAVTGANPGSGGFPVDDLHPEHIGGVPRTQGEMTFDEANELMGNPNYRITDDAGDAYFEANMKVVEYAREHGYDDSAELAMLRHERDEALSRYREAQRTAGQYRVNCQTCVVANEARRRGYDVCATGNTKGSMNEKLSSDSTLAWIDPSTGKHPQLLSFDGSGKSDALGRPIPTKASYWKWLNEDGRIREGERYTIEFEWGGKSHSGHIVSMERTSDGIRIYDPQSGKKYVGDDARTYLGRVKYVRQSYGYKYAWGPQIQRVDNLAFDKEMADAILTGAK